MTTSFVFPASWLRGLLAVLVAAVLSNPVSGRRIVIEVPYHIKAMTHTHTVYKLLPEKSPPPPPPPPSAPSVITATVPAPKPSVHSLPGQATAGAIIFPEHRARLTFSTRGIPPGHNGHLHVNLQGSLHHTETGI